MSLNTTVSGLSRARWVLIIEDLRDRFCTISNDGGQTWSVNTRRTVRNFLPIHATDGIVNPVYMGDYDTLANEFTLTLTGFVGAYSVIGPLANPDVKAARLR